MSEYLSRTGSVIVILALMVAGRDPRDAVVVRPPVQRGVAAGSTGLAAARARAFRRGATNDVAARQRREVLVKYGKNGAREHSAASGARPHWEVDPRPGGPAAGRASGGEGACPGACGPAADAAAGRQRPATREGDTGHSTAAVA